MRSVQFCPYFLPHQGGLEIFLYEWSNEWRTKYGNEALLNIIFSNSIDYSEDVNCIIIPSFEIVHNFPIPKIWRYKFWQAIWSIYKYKPTHVFTHTRFFLTTLLGGVISKSIGSKWIHTEHGSDFVITDSLFVTKTARIYDMLVGKWCLQQADTIISISHAVSEFVSELSGKSSFVNYPGVKLPPFSNKFSKQKTSQGARIKIIFAARLVRLKGCHVLFEALQIISERQRIEFLHGAISIDIFGGGPELNSLVKKAESIPLEINFKGFISRDTLIRDVYQNSEILIVPSLQEGLGLTAIEGISLGMVVIASDVGGLREISSKDDFLLFPKGDSMALANLIEYALKALPNIQGISTQSVRDKFSWKRNVENLGKILA